MSRICTVGGCGKRERSRGWCRTHYQRWYAYGDPLAEAPPYKVGGPNTTGPRRIVFTSALWDKWLADRFDNPHREHLAAGIQHFRNALARR